MLPMTNPTYQMSRAARVRDRDILERHAATEDYYCTACRQLWPCETRMEASERLRTGPVL